MTYTFTIGTEAVDTLVIKADNRDAADEELQRIADKKYDIWYLLSVEMDKEANDGPQDNERC